jgi:hypothetical protein
MRPQHSEWLREYEQYIVSHQDILEMLAAQDKADFDENLRDDQMKHFVEFKDRLDRWFLENDATPFPSVKVGSRKSAGSVRSVVSSRQSTRSGSSVTMAKAQENQRKAELLARAHALREKKLIEEEKLKIKLKEEEFQLRTEINVSDARAAVLEELERSEQEDEDILTGFVNLGTVDESVPQKQVASTPKGVTFNVEVPEFVPAAVKGQQRETEKQQFKFEHSGSTSLDLGRQVQASCSPRLQDSGHDHNPITVQDRGNAVQGKQDSYDGANHMYSYSNAMETSQGNRHDRRLFDASIVDGLMPSQGRQCGHHVSDNGLMQGNLSSSSVQMDSVVKELRKPASDLKKFSGDPLEYRRFLRQYNARVVSNTKTSDERLNFLEQFTDGEANKIVAGYSCLEADVGYPAALARHFS